MDVLTEVLNSLQLRSSVYCRAEIEGDYCLHFHPLPCAAFHVVGGADSWLLRYGRAPIALADGDLVVLPGGAEHRIASDPDQTPVADIRIGSDVPATCEVKCYLTGGDRRLLICGTFDLQQRDRHPLIALLPDLIHIRREAGPSAEWLNATLSLLAVEAGSDRPGSETLVRRLADVLFVQVIRTWIDDGDNPARGWLRALRDPQIGASLQAIHRAPDRDWSVETLAREVAMSRSAFAARFTQLVGEPPVNYLRGWRLHWAAGRLEDSDLPLAAIADQCGYGSEAAFSKAFRRQFGVNPGAYRRKVASPADRA
jgi:AraC-like DNA-binding protein